MLNLIKRSFAIKVSLIFLYATIPVYLLASFLYFNNSRKVIYNQIVKRLNTEIELIKEDIDARFFLLKGNIRAWAGLEVMKDILTDDVDKRIATVLEGLKRDYGLSGDIYAVNKKGEIVASSSPLSLKRHVDPLLLSRVSKGEVVELDTHLSEIDGREVISFAIPVNPSFLGSMTVGFLLLDYDLKDLNEVLPTGRIPFLAILNMEGKVVVAAVSEDSPKMAGLLDYITREGGAVTNPPGYITTFSRSVGYRDFKGFGWIFVGAVDEHEVLSPIRWVEKMNLLVGMSGIAVMLILVFFFSTRAVRPLKELSRQADHIAKTKDFTLRFKHKGRDEVARLADAFSNMIEEIKRHISKIREMEEEVRRADRLSALGELSAGMAHEIKNPLGVVKSSADILKERHRKDTQEGHLVGVISEEASRLEGILDAFLQFARPKPPDIRPCQLNEVLERSIKLLEPEIKKLDITLEKELDGSLPLLQVDGDQLHQVFVNILINAIHAMPEGGRLIVGSRLKLQSPEVDVVEITFSDTGSGIADGQRDKIFNPFFTTKEKGTGLGLAICHRIIDAHGGRIKVEEGIPAGTIFRIYLPMTDEDYPCSR